MTMLRLAAPSRLHFGLLARGAGAPRQFGGLGLMVDDPGLDISAERSDDWQADGPLADRALRVANEVAANLQSQGRATPPLRLTIHRIPPEHVGLGTGTQLSLAVAKLVATSAGRADADATTLATMCGRGLRSGVGIHGFERGGLVVEGGHKAQGGVAPLLARLDPPENWNVLVITPTSAAGLHGPEELQAFAALPPMPESETDRLCRLVLLGILPAVAEGDLDAFGAALEEIQQRVGSWFAPVQGGIFESPQTAEVAAWLSSQGLRGVGQSSWGPTLYGFTDRDKAWRQATRERLKARFGPGIDGQWTHASRQGATFLTDDGHQSARSR